MSKFDFAALLRQERVELNRRVYADEYVTPAEMKQIETQKNLASDRVNHPSKDEIARALALLPGFVPIPPKKSEEIDIIKETPEDVKEVIPPPSSSKSDKKAKKPPSRGSKTRKDVKEPTSPKDADKKTEVEEEKEEVDPYSIPSEFPSLFSNRLQPQLFKSVTKEVKSKLPLLPTHHYMRMQDKGYQYEDYKCRMALKHCKAIDMSIIRIPKGDHIHPGTAKAIQERAMRIKRQASAWESFVMFDSFIEEMSKVYKAEIERLKEQIF
ncbi:hypothetical protein ADUPG1_014222 [Aduncisulcus paluster]|uniref:HTH cro/C1-type domain-containing protein n=1 Tax=Aduncisulcus paluster TaxID=2918883 RepID=A0ABQ5KB86_9EUKA|nr:hypothetical protein ADUPG1_014222 [Aduncisulcus paluster]